MANLRMLCPTTRVKASELQFIDQLRDGNAVLQRQTGEHGNRIYQARDRAAVLGDFDKYLAWSAVIVQARP